MHLKHWLLQINRITYHSCHKIKLNKNTKQSWFIFKSKLLDSKNIKLIKKTKTLSSLAAGKKKKDKAYKF